MEWKKKEHGMLNAGSREKTPEAPPDLSFTQQSMLEKSPQCENWHVNVGKVASEELLH